MLDKKDHSDIGVSGRKFPGKEPTRNYDLFFCFFSLTCFTCDDEAACMRPSRDNCASGSGVQVSF